MPGSFTCTIVTPAEELFSGQVTSAVLPAHDGQRGVLKSHAPLLTQLGTGLLTLRLADGGESAYLVAGGFAQVQNDELTVLADEALSPDAVTPPQAREALDAALAMPATSEPLADAKRRAVDRARGLVRYAG